MQWDKCRGWDDTHREGWENREKNKRERNKDNCLKQNQLNDMN